MPDWYDDPVTPPAHPASVEDALEFARRLDVALPEFTRGGAYRNRYGELVTWDAADIAGGGRVVSVQTWPKE